MQDGDLPVAVVADLAAILDAAGGPDYLSRLLDGIGGLVPYDRITVTRYIVGARPEFLAHRNFSDVLVQRYLETYYRYDPFHVYWSREQRTGVVPLSRFSSAELKRGRYIAEFLNQSVIRDEVGVLLDDGARTTLAVFLERSSRSFGRRDIGRLERAFPLLAAAHRAHRRLGSAARDGETPRRRPAEAPERLVGGRLPAGLWPDLTGREREVAALILAGHPSSGIAARLGISPGTVRNHRLSIYAKLDITSEREVFLGYLDFLAAAHDS